ncbi:hypothetical protein [Pseudomonas sp. OV226]|uniref:hypothetical protein n=1 Tax=Pseudomonas sp. OV226 TaxID=2135588 RepID=UPI000D6BC048|nr:hypothetical protein [Pseudomonas sp. OV226]PWK31789.1 hypothetical protein C7534_12248 [Pseudomonas sp. OV226]
MNNAIPSIIRASLINSALKVGFINPQVRADRTVVIPHAESFASCGSDSLIEIKSFPDGVSGLFNSAQDKSSEMGHSVPTITEKDYLTLLRPSLRKYRQVLHGAEKWKALRRT